MELLVPLWFVRKIYRIIYVSVFVHLSRETTLDSLITDFFIDMMLEILS